MPRLVIKVLFLITIDIIYLIATEMAGFDHLALRVVQRVSTNVVFHQSHLGCHLQHSLTSAASSRQCLVRFSDYDKRVRHSARILPPPSPPCAGSCIVLPPGVMSSSRPRMELPNELWAEIAAQRCLSPGDLVSLALTNRQRAITVTPGLYRRVVLQSPKKYHQFLSFLRIVCDNPSLGLLVRSFTYHWNGPADKRAYLTWRLVRALRCMVHLSTLHLDGGIHGGILHDDVIAMSIWTNLRDFRATCDLPGHLVAQLPSCITTLELSQLVELPHTTPRMPFLRKFACAHISGCRWLFGERAFPSTPPSDVGPYGDAGHEHTRYPNLREVHVFGLCEQQGLESGTYLSYPRAYGVRYVSVAGRFMGLVRDHPGTFFAALGWIFPDTVTLSVAYDSDVQPADRAQLCSDYLKGLINASTALSIVIFGPDMAIDRFGRSVKMADSPFEDAGTDDRRAKHVMGEWRETDRDVYHASS